MIQAPGCSSYCDAQSFAANFLEGGVKKERKKEREKQGGKGKETE